MNKPQGSLASVTPLEDKQVTWAALQDDQGGSRNQHVLGSLVIPA